MLEKIQPLNIDQEPPHDKESETSVIGSLLQDKDALYMAIDYLQPGDFYSSERQAIFSAAYELFEYGINVDVITVGDKLRQMGKLDEIGGHYQLTWYVLQVMSSANCEYHCRIVKQYSLMRRAISETSLAVNSLFENRKDAGEIIEDLTMRLIELQANSGGKAKWISLATVVSQQIEELGNFITGLDTDRKIFGLPTGFAGIDEITCGLRKADYIVLAGRPGLGKTSFMLNTAENVVNAGLGTVGIFSLEMSNEALANRDISGDAKINNHKLMNGKISKVDFSDGVKHVLARIQQKEKVKLIDKDVYTPAQIFVNAKRLQAECPDLCLLAVDYIQIMQATNSRMNDTEKVTMFSSSLKQLAKNINVPVLALSQLSRAVEDRPDKRPQLSDLRQSGAIEQDADVVMFIYRPEVYDGSESGTAEIIIAKQRNGPLGTVKLGFVKEYTKFTNLETRYHDSHNGKFASAGSDNAEPDKHNDPF